MHKCLLFKFTVVYLTVNNHYHPVNFQMVESFIKCEPLRYLPVKTNLVHINTTWVFDFRLACPLS